MTLWSKSCHALCCWLLGLLRGHTWPLYGLHGCHSLHRWLHPLLLLLLLRLVGVVLGRSLFDEGCHELWVGLQDVENLLLLLGGAW